jgi:ParB family transcriptional regulator, chromosome partitioning protein
VDKIRPSRYQPRQKIDPRSVEELAASIRAHGLLQPVIVSVDAGQEAFELIAGERRLEAVKSLGLQEIPALVQDVDDEARLELGLIENIQREDLNPIEEAEAYRLLIEQFHLTQEQTAQRLGKKRTTISNYLRILKLPDDIQAEIASGELSAGHAKALAAIEDEKTLREALREIRSGQLTVRQTEELVRKSNKKSKKKRNKSRSSRGRAELDPDMRWMEDTLQDSLGTRVTIHPLQNGQGRIEIEYYSEDDLERLCERMGAEI